MGRTNNGDEPPPVVQGPAAFDVRSLDDPRADAWFRECIRKVLHRMGVDQNDLDDLEQETIIRANAARDRYDPSGGTVQLWLERTAVFEVLTFRRQVKRKVMRLVLAGGHEGFEAAAAGLNPEQEVHARRSLRSLCNAMPPRLAVSFEMRALGHTLAEIAGVTSLKVGGVQSQLRKVGEVRDAIVAKRGDDPKDGSNVRFGLAPLAALAASTRQSLAPSAAVEPPGQNGVDPTDSAGHGLPHAPASLLPWPAMPAAGRRLVAAMAAVLVLVFAAPLGWALFPRETLAVTLAADMPAPPLASPPGSVFEPAPASSPSTTAGQRTSPAERSRPERPAPARVPDRTAASDRLLRLAGQALQSGASSAALPAAGEHARRFPASDTGHREQILSEARRRATAAP